jgi:NADPH2:quinone reductase
VCPASGLFSLLEDIDFTVGAALPAQGLTAYGLSHFATDLVPGQSALVHAAAGGVGALLVQLLRRRGVRVFGTASTAVKLDRVRQLGAHPLPYGPGLPNLVRGANGGDGVHAVFDSVGRSTQADSLAVLGLYGHLVYFGEASGPPDPIAPDALYPRNLRVSSFWLAADPPERGASARVELQHWVASGMLRLTVGQTFPLERAAEAHRMLEQRQSQGKLLLAL